MIWSAPAAFWLAFSLLAILALHAIRQRSRRLPTTTLHIWRSLSHDEQATLRLGRVVPDWPLLLQLLLAALLVLALAAPLWLEEAQIEQDVVLILDASASMQAKEGDGTRFDRAREAALEWVAALSPGQRMALVVMERMPRLVEPFTADAEQLRQALAELGAVDASASLSQALSFAGALAKTAEQRQIVLIGDGAYHQDEEAVQVLNDSVRFFRVGEPAGGPAGTTAGVTAGVAAGAGASVEAAGSAGRAANVGIVRFAYRPYPAPRAGGELLVTLQSFAAAPRPVSFGVDLAGQQLVEQTFEVAPERQYSLVIAVPGGVRGVARAVLTSEDALPTDNRAYAVVGNPEPAEILMVGPTDPPLRAALQSIPNIRVTYRARGVPANDIPASGVPANRAGVAQSGPPNQPSGTAGEGIEADASGDGGADSDADSRAGGATSDTSDTSGADSRAGGENSSADGATDGATDDATDSAAVSASAGQITPDYDLLLYNRLPPPRVEQGAVVVIGDASPQGGVSMAGWVEDQRVTGWLTGAPLLRYLDPRQLWNARALRLVPDSEAEILVTGLAGPLMVKREAGGVRVVTLAFDLREADGFVAQESFPLLISNLVDWVRPKAGWEPEQRLRAGEPYLWWPKSASGELRVTGPRGQFWSYPGGPLPVRFQNTERAGIYTFEANGRIEQVAVNLLDAQESRIAGNPAVVGLAAADTGTRAGETVREIWPLLAILGVLVLLLEWLVWARLN